MAIQAVKSADLTFGERDAIAMVEAENLESLLGIVTTQIERIDGVERTMTNLVME
jgi:DNA-binding Lrp family transcriptional regulator